MKQKLYPAFKPSGVEWLGDVPDHWEVKRLKYSANYCVSNVNKIPSEDEISVRLCNYTDVYYNDFITSDMDLMETTATREEIEKFHLQEEDVVITKDSEEWDDIAISSLVTKSSPDLVCGYHLAVIRPMAEKLSGRYLSRQFQCSEVNHQLQVAATGVTRYGLPKSAIGEAIIPIPPLPEQQSIAAFLDRETGRIDTLVAKKERLIELLREKRSALISHAVTKGLDPSVKLKPSSVEWLGEVPAYWEVKKLRYLCNIQTGDKDTVDALDDGLYPFCSCSCVAKQT
jgi:type I restriction enzyme S subunit